MISIKFMEAIVFTGAFINDRLKIQNWHSEYTRKKFSDVVNCTARNVDANACRSALLQMDYPHLLEELTMMSGGLSLAYKGYLIFMAKYEEEFVNSNIPDMKLTLNQYFFLQFAMNFCTTKRKEYNSMLNLTGLDSKLRRNRYSRCGEDHPPAQQDAQPNCQARCIFVASTLA
ncbi:uncharacterized protein LOC119444734 [Dermacentor silvarum]|uniref:uncharacterized protein LOC119444734 n=1 Tax=Dermacentor silvarum TaxID=543639 RepID=UPI002101356A|nr:uncharacterized protein LOC119444734 [Dermacentor silvarum]